MIKYGKPNTEYLTLKDHFYDPKINRQKTQLTSNVAKRYLQQPPRKACVVCEQLLPAASFKYHGAGYTVCESCGHMNGLFEDTVEFGEFLYKEFAEGEASDAYLDETLESYMYRANSIYRPKAEFMCEAIREHGGNPNSLSYADLGAGSGHYVVAMRECGLKNSIGYDVSTAAVEQANQLLGTETLRHSDVNAIYDLVAAIEVDVVTMIFSLEHVYGLRQFMEALRANRCVKYFFFAVPVFNPSVFMEVVCPEVMPRILGQGHTHLFSGRSIERLCADFGLERQAEWWFGANAFDIHRTVVAKLRADGIDPAAESIWNEMMLPIIDELQLVFDRQKQSSEVHLLTNFVR